MLLSSSYQKINKAVVREVRGLYYIARFGVSEVTSGLTLGFQGYNGSSLLSRVYRHGNLLCVTGYIM